MYVNAGIRTYVRSSSFTRSIVDFQKYSFATKKCKQKNETTQNLCAQV